MSVRIRSFLLFGGIAIAVLALACTTAPAATPEPPAEKAPAAKAAPKAPAAEAAPEMAAVPKGGEIRIGGTGDVEGFDPASPRFAYQWGMPNIYDGLLAMNNKTELVPALATEWTIDSPTQITFKLREGVKFHDGTEFNAEAVKFNLDRILDPENNASTRSSISDIENVEVVDNLTVTLHLSKPSGPLLAFMAQRPGYMPSPTAVEKFGEDYFKNPVGTGPYSFGEWVESDHMTFERNGEHFDADRIYPDKITFQIIPDINVKLINIQTGQVDMIDSVNPKDVQGVKDDPNLTYIGVADPGYYQISLNCTTAPFDVTANRNALAAAIDREALIKATEFGLAVPARTSISPTSWAYDPSIPVPTQDLDKARASLAEAGNPDGFKFDLIAFSTPLNQSRAQVLQSQWKEVGIEASIIPMAIPQAIGALVGGEFMGMFLNSAYRGDPDASTYKNWHSEGTSNRGKCSDPTVDKLLEQARGTYDLAERRGFYAEAEIAMLEKTLQIYPMHTPLEAVVSTKVVGYEFTADFYYRFRMVGMGIEN